jgi:hypothetical protein
MPGSIWLGGGAMTARSPRAIVGHIEPPSMDTKRNQGVPTMPAPTNAVIEMIELRTTSATAWRSR